MHDAEQKAEYDLLMESQLWPAERIRAFQRERLEKLLRHARAHVPFYANRLDMLFRADGSIDWDRWTEVPILKRDDLLHHRRAMLAHTMPEGHGRIGDISTSGSTGTPVTTSHSSLALALTKAAVFRANVNDGLDFSARVGVWSGLRPDVATWPEGRLSGPWGPWWNEQSAQGEVYELNHHVAPAKALEFMARNQVRYLVCGGTDARLLAHEAERLGISVSLDSILTRGTDASADGKAFIKRVFGARTLPLYSSKEGHRMAHRCPECGQWHVNDEQVLLELLDDDNRPTSDGRSGRVVITPLWNYAQPLIRYDQGDLATAGRDGLCSRQQSAIADIVGRVRHMFIMPDGSRIVPDLPVEAVSALGAAMFQVAQVSPTTVVVRYMARSAGAPSDHAPVAEALSRILHPEISVRFCPVDGFDLLPGRKHIEFVCELE
ncbi:MAG TPA: phenylacetate--CoA ligase family protein [Alphaproteobacteria bacterium]|nr:phenylacetate--CoA ligase family protein [Alphaproteobacteria bacterium]